MRCVSCRALVTCLSPLVAVRELTQPSSSLSLCLCPCLSVSVCLSVVSAVCLYVYWSLSLIVTSDEVLFSVAAVCLFVKGITGETVITARCYA